MKFHPSEGICKDIDTCIADEMQKEINRLREALEHIATYRHGFDGTDAGRLGLYAHNTLTSLGGRDD